MRRLLLLLTVLLLLVVGWSPRGASGGEEKPPKGKALKRLVHSYLDAGFGERTRMRARFDEQFAPLEPRVLKRLRKELLKIAKKHGPKLKKSGTHYFLDEEKKRGKYIVSGKSGKALFISLHGGGAGSGTATTYMGGGGWWWIYPQVLEATEHGWTDSGTEEFVMNLIEAAKRTFKVDPNRIYLTGHSMGGYGSWTLGSHHADVFAGIAAYAGAPTCVANEAKVLYMVQPGILPSFYNLPLHVFQSGDDRNVPPQSNDFANEAMKKVKAKWPEGFNYRYDRVEGRGHAPPAEGYLPSQKWLASHARNPRPKTFLWQPVLGWKRQFYWVYWARAELEALIEVRALEGNKIQILTHEGSDDVSGLSVLLGAPLVDLGQEVKVLVNGEERFHGRVPRTFSTLLMTLPRGDADLLFDARIDL